MLLADCIGSRLGAACYPKSATTTSSIQEWSASAWMSVKQILLWAYLNAKHSRTYWASHVLCWNLEELDHKEHGKGFRSLSDRSKQQTWACRQVVFLVTLPQVMWITTIIISTTSVATKNIEQPHRNKQWAEYWVLHVMTAEWTVWHWEFALDCIVMINFRLLFYMCFPWSKPHWIQWNLLPNRCA